MADFVNKEIKDNSLESNKQIKILYSYISIGQSDIDEIPLIGIEQLNKLDMKLTKCRTQRLMILLHIHTKIHRN
jgi:hypothetical protein